MQSITQSVQDFVNDNFLFGQGIESLGESTSFLDEGIIDSTGVLELVMFLEDSFLISVEDEELVPDNLDSIDRLVSFVERKLEELGE